MRFQLPDGQIVRIDTPFKLYEVNYPANWLRLMTPGERVQFGAVELTEPPAPPPPPAQPPQVVSARQARRALAARGLLEQVETLVAQQSDTVKIDWEYAVEFRREDPTLNTLAEALPLTPADLDALFTEAAAL
jgi:hypothetical protein